MIKSKKKKVFFDMVLNILSTAIPTVILQLCILPAIASYVSDEKYGLMVTILAMLNVIPGTIGTTLNNIRLVYQEKYNEEKIIGDFHILLTIYEIINVLAIFIISWYYIGKFDFVNILLIAITGVLWLGREYHIVAFRIKLNYKAILWNNLFLILGYLIGYFIFKATGYWQYIYILGIVISYIYIYITSPICAEPFMKTKFWKDVSKDSVQLLIATFLARLINYADKLLLYPLLGGAMVSIYYVATIFGKVVSMAITPINSVALSYLAKMHKKPDYLFKWSYRIGIIVCAIGYLFAIIFSKPILKIIYPMYVDLAMPYIYITSATICVNVLTSIITPFVLKFFAMKWQMLINGVTTSCYVIISVILLHFYGMTGFCVGALFANIIKLLMTTFIYIFKNEKNDENINTSKTIANKNIEM
ncbi:polysaccharide biosynthesis protein [Clostridium sp. CAG:798]|nr:polysaccharide biosynthesis protein [Clostridium sp. CAG:798]